MINTKACSDEGQFVLMKTLLGSAQVAQLGTQ